MNGIVVVDASLVFKWLVSEENSDLAQSISRSWANNEIQAAVSYLMPVEVANALHRRVCGVSWPWKTRSDFWNTFSHRESKCATIPTSMPGLYRFQVDSARGRSMTHTISLWRTS